MNDLSSVFDLTTEEVKGTDILVRLFRWYHQFKVADGLETQPVNTPGILEACSKVFTILSTMPYLFEGKHVLDIGARDAMFSFLAAKLGAATVRAMDSDVSSGAVSLTDCVKKKNVTYSHGNILNVEDFRFLGQRDTILCLGVIYHLREPFTALRNLAEQTKVGGDLVLENALFNSPDTRPLLYCPIQDSPYEPTSCSFFNLAAQDTFLADFGFNRTFTSDYMQEPSHVRRNLAVYNRVKEGLRVEDPSRYNYWYGTSHNEHSTNANRYHRG